MVLNYYVAICIALPLILFAIYLCGRIFGLGFAASMRQLKQQKQETKSGTRQ